MMDQENQLKAKELHLKKSIPNLRPGAKKQPKVASFIEKLDTEIFSPQKPSQVNYIYNLP